ncbi:MAG: hypothetical protein BWX88_00252 [Planctomycetes bacterium ADurb.Bin126]|nr:MAG: hypothetical protein BWX88_00252 [Planctomycetes bacterium ADurb.Bin126]HQL72074.1 toll/interleukin-1 receptor domain-containing protein [Phycisphaerae bacterium]
MRIALFRDDTAKLDPAVLLPGLNKRMPGLTAGAGSEAVTIPGDVVYSPVTYKKLPAVIRKAEPMNDLVIVFTEKPYDNNFFFDSPGRTVIVSSHEWDMITVVSRLTGAAFCICTLIIEELGIGPRHQERDIGCVNDFCWDKTAIERSIRCGYICPKCLSNAKNLTKDKKALKEQVQVVLRDIADASRSEIDIVTWWDRLERRDGFDAFICYHSRDADEAKKLNAQLKARGIRTWFDKEQIPPGRKWVDVLQQRIQDVRTAVVVVGSSGIGPWQSMEVDAFIQEFLRRKCPVIPVIVKKCRKAPQLPLFLKQFQYLDFRNSNSPLVTLVWGITGQRPQG